MDQQKPISCSKVGLTPNSLTRGLIIDMFVREVITMKKFMCCVAVFLIFIPGSILAQQYVDDSGKVKVIILKDPYSDSRTGPELLKGPEHLASGGLMDVLQQSGCEVAKVFDIKMPK